MKFAFLLCLLSVSLVALPKPNTVEANQASFRSIQFVDVTAAAGIKWNLQTLAPGARYLIETMGGGGGFVDYNGDGLLDIYSRFLLPDASASRSQ